MEMGILELLKFLGEGRILDDMHNRLGEVLAAVRQCHKKGKLVLALEFHPTYDDSGLEQIEINAKVEPKLPLPNRGKNYLYLDETLGLHRRDPRQRQLPENVIDMSSDVDGKSRAAGER